MRPAPDQILSGGVRVIAAFEHSGPARRLVHHLKYRALDDYAELVAATLAERVPPVPLVPVLRSRTRWFRYGIDPALVLAKHLARHVNVPIYRLLSPPLHSRRRAGGDHDRPVARFGVSKTSLENVTLVDDVLTTGATLEAAVSVVGRRRVRAAVVANAVPRVSSLLGRQATVVP